VRPKGTPWRLGLFFLWICILFSNPLFAAEEIHSEEIADSVRNNKDPKAEINVLYIEKGAFVYGMENITQTYASPSDIQKDTDKSLEKPSLKKKKQAAKKKPIKKKAEQQLPTQKISVVLSSYPSEDFFDKSRKTISVATITYTQTLKSALPVNPAEIWSASFPNTNSLYTHALFIVRDISGSRILTRPPPSLF
jgi:hypothetical protein